MIAPLLSHGLQAWLQQRHEPSIARPAVELLLECIGIDAQTTQQLEKRLPVLGDAMAATLRLAQHQGDIVLIDEEGLPAASRVVVLAMTEGRPRLTLRRRAAPEDGSESSVDFDDLEAQMHWIRESAERAARESGSTADPVPAAREAQAFLEAVHRAKTDPTMLPLRAVYPDGGVLVLDFASARATFDADVWLSLRVHSHLPRLEPLAAPRGDLADEELDRVLWMLGMAAGDLPLLDAPDDWWHAPLTPVHLQTVGRYSIRPLHLDMARTLTDGGVTPTQLRQKCRANEKDLLAFLQACLLLCLVSWRPARLPAWAEDDGVPDAKEDPASPGVNPPGASA